MVTMEREPREVQVVLATSPSELEADADTLLLQDEEGIFLTVALTQDVEHCTSDVRGFWARLCLLYEG